MSKQNNNKSSVKLHIKKGDQVFVMRGADRDTEKPRRVLSVIAKDYRAIVEGVNMVSRHTKPNAQYPNGGIIKKEAPVHISNLMLADPKTGKPTRVGRRKENDKIVRFSKKSNEVIN